VVDAHFARTAREAAVEEQGDDGPTARPIGMQTRQRKPKTCDVE
jgi:hypothetical protein